MGVWSAIADATAGNIGAAPFETEADKYERQLFGYYDDLKAPNGDPYLQDPSAYDSIQLDPTGRNAQKRALEAYMRQQMGPTVEDQAATEGIMEDLNTQSRGQQQAIIGNLASRGRLGGGQELSARLGAQQAGANSARASGTNLAGQAYRRSMDAYTQAAGLGGQMHAQDYSEASQRAQANDRISAANTAARERASQRNFENDLRVRGLKREGIEGQRDYYQRKADQQRAQAHAAGEAGDEITNMGVDLAANAATGGGYGAAKGVGEMASGVTKKKNPYGA